MIASSREVGITSRTSPGMSHWNDITMYPQNHILIVNAFLLHSGLGDTSKSGHASAAVAAVAEI